jgi:hypothetical protein
MKTLRHEKRSVKARGNNVVRMSRHAQSARPVADDPSWWTCLVIQVLTCSGGGSLQRAACAVWRLGVAARHIELRVRQQGSDSSPSASQQFIGAWWEPCFASKSRGDQWPPLPIGGIN